MPSQKNSQPSSNLPSFAEALAAAEQMQQDWLEHGVNFVERYVEDVDGNWLEEWGTDESAENGSVSSDANSSQRSVDHDLFIQSIVTFLISDDPVALAALPFWKSRPLPEIAARLERCLTLPEADHPFAVQNLLISGSLIGITSLRGFNNQAETIDTLELAESLLEKLRGISFS